jgi:hypothetical protein
MGMKCHDTLTGALCRECHAQLDQGKDLAREDRRNIANAAIVETLRELTERGFFEDFEDGRRNSSTRTPSKIIPNDFDKGF